MRQLLQVYLESLQRRNCSPSTIKGLRWNLRKFIAFLGDLPRNELTAQHLADYKLFLQAQPQLHKRTVYDRFGFVRTWLGWAYREGLLVFDPAANFVEKAPPHRVRRVPTQEQMDRLLNSPRNTQPGRRDRVLLELLYGTGLRAGEVCALNLVDFDRAASGLWVRRGKGGKDRLAPLGPRLVQLLEEYFKSSRPQFKPRCNAIFLTVQSQRLTPIALSLIVHTNAIKCNLDGVCTHSLRHAFATHLLERGASLLEVKLLLGHVRFHTTQRYTSVVPHGLIKEYQRTHPRAKRRAR